jgi:hypothetical protein
MTAFVVCTNSHSSAILGANLARSPCLATIPLHVEAGAPSAAVGYNRALDATEAPVLILCHHDVFLPRGFEVLLAARLAEIAARDPDWAVVGAYGIGLDGAGIGPVWSSSLGQIVGRVALAPTPVQAVDELLIVLRRASGLRFDEGVPGWHMYGPDIAQEARARGLGAYAGGLPCIHNDGPHDRLGPDFGQAYRYMQRKWAARLPIRTPMTKISRSGLHLIRDQWHARRAGAVIRGLATDTGVAPEVYAARCGWADLTASA